MSELHNEIIEALQMNPEDLPDAEPLDPADSPLNYPVKEKEMSSGKNESQSPPPADAPEQQIGDTSNEGAYEVPGEQALAFADFILDAANNIIEVGAGFFIKIKKHDEFYAYEELIQVIEEQNTKNIRRLTLDEMDKAMLRPLLALVLRKRAKVLSPEQQLLVAMVSILIKKAQVVMEVRAENQVLTERIKGIIQTENAKEEQAPQEQENKEEVPEAVEVNPNQYPVSPIVDVSEEEPESPFPNSHSIAKHEKPSS